mmetsp:Transcript_379/g.1093  ORF Transcript_379/g.1093 Transcript_379/m.1093 type:complete len:373 (+) Transcript_379:1099-2217(+)
MRRHGPAHAAAIRHEVRHRTGHRSVIHEAAGPRRQQQQPVEERRDLGARLMYNYHDQRSVLVRDVPQRSDHKLRVRRREARRRLVGEETVRPGAQTFGERDASPLAAGDAADVRASELRIRDVREAEVFQEAVVCSVDKIRRRAEGQIGLEPLVKCNSFSDGAVFEAHVLLRHVRRDKSERPVARPAVEVHSARVGGGLDVGNHVEKRRFAATGRPHERDELRRLEVAARRLQDDFRLRRRLGQERARSGRAAALRLGRHLDRKREVLEREVARFVAELGARLERREVVASELFRVLLERFPEQIVNLLLRARRLAAPRARRVAHERRRGELAEHFGGRGLTLAHTLRRRFVRARVADDSCAVRLLSALRPS